jgi:hypothetical protein
MPGFHFFRICPLVKLIFKLDWECNVEENNNDDTLVAAGAGVVFSGCVTTRFLKTEPEDAAFEH